MTKAEPRVMTTVDTSLYRVYRVTSGTVRMSSGLGSSATEWKEPRVSAWIYRRQDNTLVAGPIFLNSALLCTPGGSVRGVDATDEQIIEAVIGDEHIYG